MNVDPKKGGGTKSARLDRLAGWAGSSGKPVYIAYRYF